MDQYIKRITAVINTLNAATIRADQIDAINRINMCTMELRDMIREMQSAPAAAPEKEEAK